ncbi:MAG: hypothetical protein JW958_07575 [Candidatus Eisenbacteria bacterium]|nr:hypothetical protein [Candidatus Eisenbacteria bacterium]
MRRLPSLLSCLLLLCALLPAGRAAADSQFASNALGVGIRPVHVRAWAMGALETALADTSRLSLSNPALAAGMNRVSMNILYHAERRHARSGEGEHTYNSSGFPLFEFLIPIGDRLALGLGYHELQDMGTEKIRLETFDDPVDYTTLFERHGSVFRVPAVAAFRLFRDVRIGLRLDTYFLSIEEDYDLDFADSDIRDTRERFLIGGDGTGGAVGVLLPLGRSGSLGFTWSQEVRLRVDRQREGLSGTVSGERARIEVAPRFGAGLSWRFDERWTAGAEYALSSWESVKDTVAALGGYRDVASFAIGLERMPDRNDPWFVRLPLRAGFRVDPLMYGDREGNRIDRWAVTCGTGFSLGGGAGICDLAVEYGRIGDQDRNGLEESYTRVVVGFTGQEPWRRRKSYLE